MYENEILPRLNTFNHPLIGGSKTCESLFNDKNYYPYCMPDFKQPRFVIRRMAGQFYDSDFNRIDFDKALSIANEYDNLVFKVSRDSSCGHGVTLVPRSIMRKSLILLTIITLRRK